MSFPSIQSESITLLPFFPNPNPNFNLKLPYSNPKTVTFHWQHFGSVIFRNSVFFASVAEDNIVFYTWLAINICVVLAQYCKNGPRQPKWLVLEIDVLVFALESWFDLQVCQINTSSNRLAVDVTLHCMCFRASHGNEINQIVAPERHQIECNENLIIFGF